MMSHMLVWDALMIVKNWGLHKVQFVSEMLEKLEVIKRLSDAKQKIFHKRRKVQKYLFHAVEN